MKKIALHWQIIIALILGLLYALLAYQFQWDKFTLNFIKPIGDIFIKILKLIALPLVLFSIISGITSLKNVKAIGRVGFKTLAIYIITTMLAVTIGLLAVNLIKPGQRVNEEMRLEKRVEYEIWKNATQAKSLDNICITCDSSHAQLVNNVKSRLEATGNISDPDLKEKLEAAANTKSQSPLQPLVDVVPSNIFAAFMDTDMLQIIFFAIFFGIVIIMLPEDKTRVMIEFVESGNIIFTKMVDIVIAAMPYFVFALMASALANISRDNLSNYFDFLLKYSLTVFGGLLLVAFVIYPLFIGFFSKRISFKSFLKAIREAQMTAFSTSSSLATLPITMDAVHNKLKVKKKISSFVLPIGATINMDGTSLYQAVAAIGLAQLHMIDLSLGQQITIVITATLASIGAAAIPSAGLVLLIVVLDSLGLNPEWFILILPIDRILDMCRTVVNVTGDAMVTCVVASTSEDGFNQDAVG